jgi:hypothetical protein
MSSKHVTPLGSPSCVQLSTLRTHPHVYHARRVGKHARLYYVQVVGAVEKEVAELVQPREGTSTQRC